jgi:porin
VVFDADLLLTPQGVLSGGGHWLGVLGQRRLHLNIDTGKLGLWPGGFFKILRRQRLRGQRLPKSGAIVPPNAMALLPKPNDPPPRS